MLAVAAYKTGFDVSAVERKLQGMGPDANEHLRGTYQRMLATGGERLAIKPQDAPEMTQLCAELPNFGAPLRDIQRSLALCADSRDPVEIMPMLLLGDPGIGKTHFARRVSALLGTSCAVAPMNALTAGWILSGVGVAAGWHLAQRVDIDTVGAWVAGVAGPRYTPGSDVMGPAILIGIVGAGLMIGLLAFEFLVFFGVRRMRFANAPGAGANTLIASPAAVDGTSGAVER